LDPKQFSFLPNNFNANFLLVGVLSGNAIERINDSPLIEVILTDSIPIQNMPKFSPKITVLSVAHLMGEAIRRIHNEESVSSLFQFS
jgi:ribose-phosphate pyrophosphokinase